MQLRALRPHVTTLGPYRWTDALSTPGGSQCVRDFVPGQVIKSRDGRSIYGVMPSGAFRNLNK